jgi:hypothetical protein
MLARAHRSAAVLNLDFDPLESELTLLQPKQLSYLYLDHLAQQLVIHDGQRQPAARYLDQQEQPEVPVVQG